MGQARGKQMLKAAAAAAQPQVLVEIKVQFLDNSTLTAIWPDTQDRKLLAHYVQMLLQAANIIINQRLVPGEGGRIHLPPGVMNG